MDRALVPPPPAQFRPDRRDDGDGLGPLLLHTLEIWLWAAAYVALGVVQGFPDALYFSTVTFSTLGSGDIMPRAEWRLFASFEAVNGFILIGWSIAYLIAASTRHGPFRLGEHF